MKTIEVPESLTRAQYTSLLDAVGFDPKSVRRLEFRIDGVYAEVFDLNKDGHIHVHVDGDEVVVNRVFIPIRENA